MDNGIGQPVGGDRTLYIKYYPNEDTSQAIERARRRYGRDKKFVLVPASLWKQWKIKGQGVCQKKTKH